MTSYERRRALGVGIALAVYGFMASWMVLVLLLGR